MITIIDYGVGNLASVSIALQRLAIPFTISQNAGDLHTVRAIILPGVGNASKGMENLRSTGFDRKLIELVNQGIPILGICLGMQLLFSHSQEGDVSCLGVIEGSVQKFTIPLKVPQIGWNTVTSVNNSILFKDVPKDSYFYFVNSYYCIPRDTKLIAGETDYACTFCSVVQRDNLYGVQFHPEKSSTVGLQVLRNFWDIVC